MPVRLDDNRHAAPTRFLKAEKRVSSLSPEGAGARLSPESSRGLRSDDARVRLSGGRAGEAGGAPSARKERALKEVSSTSRARAALKRFAAAGGAASALERQTQQADADEAGEETLAEGKRLAASTARRASGAAAKGQAAPSRTTREAAKAAASKKRRDEIVRASIRRRLPARSAAAYRARALGGQAASAASRAAYVEARGASLVFERARRVLAALAPSVAGAGGAGVVALPLAALIVVFALLVGIVGGDSFADDDWNLEGLSETERTVALYFKSQGLDKVHVAAIMGNFKLESGMNPTAESDPGGAGQIGLAQWGRGGANGGRGDVMIAWAASIGEEWTDIHVQLDWAWAEMTDEGRASGQTSFYSAATSPAAYESFLSITGVDEATEFFEGWIEVSGGQALDKRIEYAREYLATFNSGSASEGAEAVIAEAYSHLGATYVFGSAGPDTFDCSGLVKYCFELYGYDLGGARTSEQIYNISTHVSAAEAQRGDIIAFANSTGIYHIAIYLGDGMMIHTAGNPDGVEVEAVWSGAMYGRLT